MGDIYGRLYGGAVDGVVTADAFGVWADICNVIVNTAAGLGVSVVSVSCELSLDDVPLCTSVNASGDWGGVPCVWSAPVVRVYRNGLYCAQLVGGGYTLHLWRHGVHDELWRVILSAVADRMASM